MLVVNEKGLLEGMGEGAFLTEEDLVLERGYLVLGHEDQRLDSLPVAMKHVNELVYGAVLLALDGV